MVAALEETGAFLDGHFQLNSGRHSGRYLEKFNLLQWPHHTDFVCQRIADAVRVHGPETVAGPTLGGVILAYEIARQLDLRGIIAERDEAGGRSFQRDFRISSGEKVLVVDDVLTTGESVRDTIAAVHSSGGIPVAIGVLVDRSAGAIDFGLPLFAATQVDMESYEPSDCPLCREGVDLTIT